MSEKLKEYKDVIRVASPAEVHKLYMLYFTGLLPYAKIGFQAIWLPQLTESFKYNLR